MASSDFTAMFGDALLTADGERPTSEVLAGCEAVGIYFSAHWCPPCRRFTPEVSDSIRQQLCTCLSISQSALRKTGMMNVGALSHSPATLSIFIRLRLGLDKSIHSPGESCT